MRRMESTKIGDHCVIDHFAVSGVLHHRTGLPAFRKRPQDPQQEPEPMKKIYLVSTVGISLLRNCLPPDTRNRLFRFANLAEKELSEDARSLIETASKNAARKLAAAERADLKLLSAELNGILSYEDEFKEKPLFHHVLLVTDTFIGKQAAALLSDWLGDNGVSAESWAVPDLRTAHGSELRTALSGMVPDLVERNENAIEDGWHVVFNLTGGFKGVNGFLQTAAMLWANETIYVFEGSKELMHIPRLPVTIDTQQMTGENFDLFRRMAFREEIDIETARQAGIAGSLLFELDGKAVLSEWGELVWQKALREISSSKLLDPVHPNILFSKRFRRDVSGLSADRLRLVNRAIDLFGHYLAGNPQGRLDTLDFHPLKGNKHAPSTHQIDAWSDRDASRIYMYEENKNWVLNELKPHE